MKLKRSICNACNKKKGKKLFQLVQEGGHLLNMFKKKIKSCAF